MGLPAAGPHTNGYSLVRRALERGNPTAPLGDTTVIDAALTPHASYVDALLRAFRIPGVHAAAHITGGGLIDNLPRVLPDGLAARLSPAAWTMPPLYAWIQATADVTPEEMYRVFNMGVGVVIVCRPRRRRNAAGRASRRIHGRIGGPARRRGGGAYRRVSAPEAA